MLFNIKPPKNTACRQHGFTLLELLLALTLVSLIVVLAYGSLRIGIRAWEKGEQGTGQKERVVLQLLQRQVASIIIPTPFTGDEAPPMLLGTNDSLALASHIGLRPENNQRAVYVRYAVRQQGESLDLLFWEKPIALIKKDDIANINLDDMQPLLTGLQNISFSFLQSIKTEGEDEFSWLTSWPPEEGAQGLPLGVKISLQDRVDSPADSILIPIRPTPEEGRK